MQRILSVWREDIQRKIHTRHYYLRQARIALMRNEISDMHKYCRRAEQEQIHIDEYAKWHNIETVGLYNR